MLKKDLRTIYLQRRQELTEEQRAVLSSRISRRVLEFIENKTGLLQTDATVNFHSFLPMKSGNEIDAWKIIKKFEDYSCIQWATSKITGSGSKNLLTHYTFNKHTEFESGQWEIPYPVNTDNILPKALDMVIVPLLTFNGSGHRVGYGKGYYDRFLTDCNPSCLKIGVSFFSDAEQIDDINDQDIALDACITPEETLFFPL